MAQFNYVMVILLCTILVIYVTMVYGPIAAMLTLHVGWRAALRTARAGDGVQQRARDEKAGPRHQERRQRLDGEADRQVRGAPDEIDRRERGDHARA